MSMSRRARPIAFALAFLLPVIACGPADEAADSGSDLVIERTTTEDGLPLVRNVSGATWGSPAHLEEELSIGVLEGEDEYMLGEVSAVWATEDRVYVVDSQVITVRVYDREGLHLMSIGREGSGPGEFGQPISLVRLADGTLAVTDLGGRRVVFFSPDGEPAGTWTPEGGFGYQVFPLDDGRVQVAMFLPRDESDGRPSFTTEHGLAELSADRALGDVVPVPTLGYEEKPLILTVGDRSMMMGGILDGASHHWTVRPDGTLVVGVSTEYRFLMVSDGRSTVVERYWQPVPIDPAENDYRIRRVEGLFRRMAPDYRYDGDPPAAVWPAYMNLYSDRDDRVWVVRRVPSELVTDCVEDPREDPTGAGRNPCWVNRSVIDAFAPDGAYLGELVRPEGVQFRSVFIDGDEYWAAVEDQDGVVKVKRYRIVTDDTT